MRDQKRRSEGDEHTYHRYLHNDDGGGKVRGFFNTYNQNRSDHHDHEEPNVIVFEVHGHTEQSEIRGRKWWQVPANIVQECPQVTTPAYGYSGCAKCILPHEVPSIHPCHQFPPHDINI